ALEGVSGAGGAPGLCGAAGPPVAFRAQAAVGPLGARDRHHGHAGRGVPLVLSRAQREVAGAQRARLRRLRAGARDADRQRGRPGREGRGALVPEAAAAWPRRGLKLSALPYLFFSLPRGMTDVTGATGRSDVAGPLGALVSFLGFLLIFSLRCSLPMGCSCCAGTASGWRRMVASVSAFSAGAVASAAGSVAATPPKRPAGPHQSPPRCPPRPSRRRNPATRPAAAQPASRRSA